MTPQRSQTPPRTMSLASCGAEPGTSAHTAARVLDNSTIELGRRSAIQLGASGRWVHEARVFTDLAVFVLDIDIDAHEHRQRHGHPPETDGQVLAMWEWPELARTAPRPVVKLCATLVVARQWRAAVQAAARWAAFTPTALVVTDGNGHDREERALECHFRGVGCVDAGPERLAVCVPLPAHRAAGARRRTLDRWVEETLYVDLISSGVLTSA